MPSFRNSYTDSRVFIQVFDSTVSVDRSIIQEDQTDGQVIRAYVIDVLSVISKDKIEWIEVVRSTSIGNKKIDLWQKGPLLVRAVRLNITATVDAPVLRVFTVHLCN